MTTLPASQESYWMASTTAPSYLPPTDDLEADVAVVGAGIAGICTAWELAQRGRSVVLLDAGRIAASVSGYTTAKLSAQHTLIYAQLRKSHGADGARMYAQSQQDAVERVAATSAELGIDCDFEWVPSFTYVEDDQQVDSIRAEVEAAREAGLIASFVTETVLPYPVAAAIRVDDQAQFHPRRYLLGLAEEMTRRGVRIHERTRVVGLDEGEPCTLTTEGGRTITARDVVVATHYPVFDRAMLFARLEPHRECVVAGVIPAERDPEGTYITPEHNTRSVRTAPYGDGERLLIITGESDKPGVGSMTERFERLAAWTVEHFAPREIAYRWATQDNTTTDQVPFVGPFHLGAKHTYVATGFGGWGMTNGVMAGRLLASLIAGEELPWAKLYDPRRVHPVREAFPATKLQASVAKHFVGDRLRPSSAAGSVADVSPGSGAVVRVGRRQCAVYRDEAGVVHGLSARCTHLGCIVHFNDAETSWDCPCHGSRFAIDGSILQGPAQSPLEPQDIDG